MFGHFQGRDEKGCMPSTMKKAVVDVDHYFYLVDVNHPAFFMVDVGHPAFFNLVDVDHPAFFMVEVDNSAFFMEG